MKKRFTFVLSLFILTIIVCTFSMIYVNSSMDEMEEMRIMAMKRIEQEDREEAEAIVSNMLSFINSRATVLEMLIQHDDLHEMVMQLTDAKVSLTIDDMDDFDKAMSLFYENLEHIRAHEQISLSNIF